MTLRKPHKACDLEEKFLRFPLIASPKMDGIRGLIQEGRLYSRTLKLHPNLHSQSRLGKPENDGLDGELILDDPVDPLQCNKVGSAVGTIGGSPEVDLYVFDWLTAETEGLTYEYRLAHLSKAYHVKQFAANIKLMPSRWVWTLEELKAQEQEWLEQGYEGIILRDPKALHKQNRSTARECGYLRRKPWQDSEGLVIGIKEGQKNCNPAETNELGRTKRSTHQENMVPNGLVGTIIMEDCYTKQVLNVSTGNMTEAERKFYFENQDKLIGKIGKYKAVHYGKKDAPRFAGWLGFRNPEEM